MTPETKKPRIRLLPITRKRRKTPDPGHVASLLQDLAQEQEKGSGRYNLLMEAAAMIKTAYPNRAAL